MKLILLCSLLLISCGQNPKIIKQKKYIEGDTLIIDEIDGERIAEVIDPCGDGPGADEVLLILTDGSVIAWYLNLGLTRLTPGNYVTTDQQQCLFNVSNDYEVTF